jgi:hypothetical protein
VGVVARAAEDKARGEQSSRVTSLAAATVAGLVTAVIVYKVLRSNG